MKCCMGRPVGVIRRVILRHTIEDVEGMEVGQLYVALETCGLQDCLGHTDEVQEVIEAVIELRHDLEGGVRILAQGLGFDHQVRQDLLGLDAWTLHEPNAPSGQRAACKWTEVETHHDPLHPCLHLIDRTHGFTLPCGMARLDRLQYLISFGYDGSLFYGVPNQPGFPTVSVSLRKRLEDAAGQRARALNFTARTDRGVHAVENLATCYFLPPMDTEAFEAAVAEERSDGLERVVATLTDFHTHARNVGRGKWYRYRLRTDDEADSRAWAVPTPSDPDAMRALAQAFVGTHDFSAYSYKITSPSVVKSISRVDLTYSGTEIIIDIEGNGF